LPADHVTLPAATSKAFGRLDTWRNFLVHGDEQSRRKLKEQLGVDGLSIPAALTANLAGEIIAMADAAFTFAGAVTGVQALTSEFLWVAGDEL
jgi:hypothetical protein